MITDAHVNLLNELGKKVLQLNFVKKFGPADPVATPLYKNGVVVVVLDKKLAMTADGRIRQNVRRAYARIDTRWKELLGRACRSELSMGGGSHVKLLVQVEDYYKPFTKKVKCKATTPLAKMLAVFKTVKKAVSEGNDRLVVIALDGPVEVCNHGMFFNGDHDTDFDIMARLGNIFRFGLGDPCYTVNEVRVTDMDTKDTYVIPM